MAVWEAAMLSDDDPGSRIDVNSSGSSLVRILSPSFRLNDGGDYTYVGWGNQIIQGTLGETPGGAGGVGSPMGLLLTMTYSS